MKPKLHKLPLLNDTSFVYQRLDCKYFDKPWHFHEEYELMAIEKSRGTKFIGDKVSLFDEGEIMLIGSNIPHLFRNHEDYYRPGSRLKAKSTFIHFKEDFLGPQFFNLPEMARVRKLLGDSAYALQIKGKTHSQIFAKLAAMNNQPPPQRLISLLEILVQLADSNEVKPMLSTNFAAVKRSSTHEQNNRDINRINQVVDFIMKNYKRQIYLDEAAALLNMSGISFSRYFKHHTQKTFSEYLTEIRISHACNLLMGDQANVSQVCYSSGFNNLSNFYKHFKRITGVIPKDFRTRFLSK